MNDLNLGVVGRKSTRIFSVVEVDLATMLNVILVEFFLLTMSLETGEDVVRMLFGRVLTVLKWNWNHQEKMEINKSLWWSFNLVKSETIGVTALGLKVPSITWIFLSSVSTNSWEVGLSSIIVWVVAEVSAVGGAVTPSLTVSTSGISSYSA